MKVALRIDVDTLRGTQIGVPNLLRLLDRHSIRASFFFCVGPDNMGRHLWRLIRPQFLYKMLRTRAASLYGWDILLKGTFWPGPLIGKRAADVIRATATAGHEIGLHAWDHHRWQMHIDGMTLSEIGQSLRRGVETLTEISGRPPTCSAAPGWRCNDQALEAKEGFGFSYNSDCRGNSVFLPKLGDKVLSTPQIPVDLPTYDELIGTGGVDADNFNDRLISLMGPDKLNTLTIHAEVEGIGCLRMFEKFIDMVRAGGGEFIPFGAILDGDPPNQAATVEQRSMPGREGWLAFQSVN
jgi:undecaprenyl phosphate-alpha-L-ara4FN deformylase